MTGTDLSKLYNCSVQYISQLVKDGMPKESDGSYDINKVVPWYVERLKGAKKTDEAQARARKIAAEAAMKEIELRQMEENLIEVDDAIQELSQIIMAMKSQLDSLPTKVAPQVLNLSASEAEGLLRKYVDETLLELSMIPQKLYAINELEENDNKETIHNSTGE